ncbi:hypothetical protein A6P39_026815 [Streptomyces sp. FXJ1.172]|uniref:hypothetical protein n=1 Tax=Streptomyces sp. FXJ1.172 TaxID=710705 RepID=UPI0007CFF631|nr:hypothetical protein [Streptomyces sp. FXJ1.172]WEO97339.1 hypothetical protein A6P39_026815 [Streptomyces sp. FXJ1.172]
MKSTTRGTLAAVVTGVAAAVGAAATPAAAVGTVPVPVPLQGLSNALGTEVPKAGLEVPVPLLMPSVPEGPRYVTGHLLPERTLPPVPFTGALPGASLRAPVPQVLGDHFDHVGATIPVNDLRTLTPGLSVDAPLTPPNPDHFGLPDLKQPEVGLIAPVLQTVANADLSGGPGL